MQLYFMVISGVRDDNGFKLISFNLNRNDDVLNSRVCNLIGLFMKNVWVI